jgi:CheY-like chemotaxis protein
MDWKMPGMDGIEATKRIRDMVKGDIPHILMITAYDKEEIKDNYAAEVVDRFIEKPVSQSALIDGIQSALGVKKHSTTNVFAHGDVPILNGARILLVEDNELNQQVAMELLLDTGVSIELATDGLMALQAAQSISFDLILMDIQMPEMDGLQATREIRKFDTSTPIVAMTAHAMEGDRDRSLDAGMNAHITKPIEPAELYNILSSHILQGGDYKGVKTGSVSRDIAQEGSTSFGVQVLKQINALNVPKAIERFQGRSSLYIDLVDDFLREYSNIASDLVAAQHEQNTDLFYRKVHSLKSNAAYIGAFELSDMLGELETRLQNTQDIDELFPTILAQVKDLLRQLIEKQELRKKHDDEMCLDSEDKSASLTLTTLLPLLQNSDFKVEAKIAGLKENTNCDETLEMLGILENLVDEMEFEEASTYLQNWIKEHPQDENKDGNGS